MGIVGVVQKSNLFTMRASFQKVLSEPGIPDLDTRRLRANVIFEECMETIEALGFTLAYNESGPVFVEHTNGPDLEGIVDGSCDSIYVHIGTLTSCGVVAGPHMKHVCDCNDAKFPDGKGVPHPDVPNKFGKPPGWEQPDHESIWKRQTIDLSAFTVD